MAKSNIPIYLFNTWLIGGVYGFNKGFKLEKVEVDKRVLPILQKDVKIRDPDKEYLGFDDKEGIYLKLNNNNNELEYTYDIPDAKRKGFDMSNSGELPMPLIRVGRTLNMTFQYAMMAPFTPIYMD